MNRWIRNLPLAAIIAIAAPAAAQEAIGDWRGVLEVSEAARLPLAVHIARSEAGGELIGTLDSPSQGAFGITLADIAIDGGGLSFTVPSIGGRFTARWDAAANGWAGRWVQGPLDRALALAAAPARPAPPPLPADWTIPGDAEIGRLLDERIATRPGEGIVAGVIDANGRRIVARGPAGGTAFDARTVFEIGSMTKVFTGLLLADMVARGEVSLDDPAERYLPEGAHMPRRDGRQITLRDLATHSSGLPRLPSNLAPADPANPYADYTEARLLEFLGSYQLTRDIGVQFEYSNLGMGLLGYLLARRAGTDYATLVRQRITGPLGMRDTTIALSDDQRAHFAQGHDAELRPVGGWDFDTLAGAGAIRSTAADMLIFLDAFIAPGDSPLAPAMRAMLAESRPGPSPNARIGLAWMMLDLGAGRLAFHDGGTGGFRTAMGWDPARHRGVVVLTNAAMEPSSNDLALHILAGAPVAATRQAP